MNISRPFFAGTVVDEENAGGGCVFAFAEKAPCVDPLEIGAQIDRLRPTPPVETPLIEELWVVFTPPEIAVCEEPSRPGSPSTFCGGAGSAPQVCGFHEPETFLSGVPVPTAIVPFNRYTCTLGMHNPEEPAHSPEPDSEAASLASLVHELAEAITDVHFTGWLLPETLNVAGEEVSDYCSHEQKWAPELGKVANVPYNQVIGSHHYWVAGLYSDAVQECAGSFEYPLQAAFTAEPKPAGQSTQFNGSGSADKKGKASARWNKGEELVESAGKIATYTWSFGDGSEETTTVPTATHTYAKGGTYLVPLTITDANSGKTEKVPITNTAVRQVTIQEGTTTTTTTSTTSTTQTTATGSTSSSSTTTSSTTSTSNRTTTVTTSTAAIRTPGPGSGPKARIPLVVGRRIVVFGRLARIKLRCQASRAARCKGRVAVAVVVRKRLRRHRRAVVVRRRILIGEAAFAVPGGSTRAVALHLVDDRVRLLERLGRGIVYFPGAAGTSGGAKKGESVRVVVKGRRRGKRSG